MAKSILPVERTGRLMDEWIKEDGIELQLALTQSSAVSEHAKESRHYLPWDKVLFILTATHTGTPAGLKRSFT